MALRISIVHQHTNNFGDDAAGLALITAIRDLYPDTIFDVFYIWHRGGSPMPGAGDGVTHHMLDSLSGDKERRPEWAIRSAANGVGAPAMTPELAEMVSICLASDHVFVSPAGSNIGIYKDWMYLLSLALLTQRGVRLTFCQNSIHSSGSAPFDRIAKKVLKKSLVYVRETASATYLREAGVPSVLGVDTALSAPFPTRSVSAAHERKTLTVVPTKLSSWHRDHRSVDDSSLINGTIGSAIRHFVNQADHAVELLGHLYGPEDESDMLSALAEELRTAGVETTVTKPDSAAEYEQAICNTDVVLSMRYHGLVLAGHAATPCVALAYENKMVEAAGYLGMREFCLDVGSVTSDEIVGALNVATNDRAAIVEHLTARRTTLQWIAKAPVGSIAASQIRENPEPGFNAELGR